MSTLDDLVPLLQANRANKLRILADCKRFSTTPGMGETISLLEAYIAAVDTAIVAG